MVSHCVYWKTLNPDYLLSSSLQYCSFCETLHFVLAGIKRIGVLKNEWRKTSWLNKKSSGSNRYSVIRCQQSPCQHFNWGMGCSFFLISMSCKGGALFYFCQLCYRVLNPLYVKPSIQADILSVSTCQSFVRLCGVQWGRKMERRTGVREVRAAWCDP